jgi:hypothetical protein
MPEPMVSLGISLGNSAGAAIWLNGWFLVVIVANARKSQKIVTTIARFIEKLDIQGNEQKFFERLKKRMIYVAQKFHIPHNGGD